MVSPGDDMLMLELLMDPDSSKKKDSEKGNIDKIIIWILTHSIKHYFDTAKRLSLDECQELN